MIEIRPLKFDDYDELYALWTSVDETKRALNPVDDSREGIEVYLTRNPHTCFAAYEGNRMVAAILSGHDGRRGLIHHLCVAEEARRKGLAKELVQRAEAALRKEGVQKIFCVVLTDNDRANAFWEHMGYSRRSNINYRNKSLNSDIPTGE